MAKPTGAKVPFVIVEWNDAWGDSTEDVYISDIALSHKPMVMQTSGWLLLDDGDGVSLASEYCPQHDSYRGRSFIPRGMIRLVTPFKLIKPRVKKCDVQS